MEFFARTDVEAGYSGTLAFEA